MRLLDQLHQHARTQPNALAVCRVDADARVTHTLTYLQYHRAVHAVARQLAVQTPPGATIIVQLPNLLEYPVLFLATLASGRTIFPLHPALTPHEVRQAAKKSGAQWIVSQTDTLAGLEHISPEHLWAWVNEADESPTDSFKPDTGQAAMLLQSSGTTGLPKIVRRSATSIDAVAQNVVGAVPLNREDQILAAIPLCHSYGIENGVVAPLWAGATVYACPGFDPHVIAALWSALQNVVVPAVPIMVDLLASTADLPLPGNRLRSIYSAGATLPAAVSDKFAKRFGHAVGQLYGATEIGSVTFGRADDPRVPAGSVGLPMNGVSIRVLDIDAPDTPRLLSPGEEGQIAVAAPSMLDRYLDVDADALPLIDGHYLTGDLGHLSPDGAMTITGRIKTLIEVGGIKVNPMEVEQVLAEHPGVAECVVVPVRITDTLSRLTAFITASDPHSPPSPASLREHARSQLAAYKVPRAFTVVPSLPRSSLGKVQRRVLMESRP